MSWTVLLMSGMVLAVKWGGSSALEHSKVRLFIRSSMERFFIRSFRDLLHYHPVPKLPLDSPPHHGEERRFIRGNDSCTSRRHSACDAVSMGCLQSPSLDYCYCEARYWSLPCSQIRVSFALRCLRLQSLHLNVKAVAFKA